VAGLFDKIKKDVKMSELTAEGKRQYKMFDLKAKIQSKMTELGGRAYDVLDSKKSPAVDSKVKAVYVKIKKLEEQLSKLEGGKETKAAAGKKPAAKAKATRKKTVRAAAKKTATMAAQKAPAKK
jgi:hypothetical protein